MSHSGTSQQNRLERIIQQSNFLVDERTFDDLLMYGKRLASGLRYYSTDNKVVGSWEALFENNPVVIMASISTLNIKKLKEDFARQLDRNVYRQLLFVIKKYMEVNSWYSCLSQSKDKWANDFSDKIHSVISKSLKAEMHKLGTIINHLMNSGEMTIQLTFEQFHEVWEINISTDGQAIFNQKYNELIIDVRENNTQIFRRQIQHAFIMLINGLVFLKQSEINYPESLLHSQEHDPALGLFMVFLKLYSIAQNAINQFTDRHREFYYKKILATLPENETVESAYLTFNLLPDAKEPVSIPKGTYIIPGYSPPLNQVRFQTESSLLVTDASVTTILSLLLLHDNKISPQCEFNYITGLQCKKVFGENKNKNKSENPVLDFSHLGIAIESKDLWLAEGERQLVVKFEFDIDNSTKTELLKQVDKANTAKELTLVLGKLFSCCLLSTQAINNNSTNHWLSESENEEVRKKVSLLLDKVQAEYICNLFKQSKSHFFKLVKDIFIIKLSTVNGWQTTKKYLISSCTIACDNKRIEDTNQYYGFELTIDLPCQFPPIIACDMLTHGDHWQTDNPVLQILCNPNAYFYPYSLFLGCDITSITIESKVRGLTELKAYNEQGVVDINKPFKLFGIEANVNANFIFGNYEAVNKSLIEVSLNITWDNLPEEGFNAYYTGYPSDYGYNVFKTTIAKLSQGNWIDLSSKKMPLFTLVDTKSTNPEQLQDLSDKKNNINIANNVSFSLMNGRVDKKVTGTTILADDQVSKEKYVYNINTSSGFFKLTLTNPVYGFGFSEHQITLAKVLAYNNMLLSNEVQKTATNIVVGDKEKLKKQEVKIGGNKFLPMPNKPFIPTVSKITLDYQSKEGYDFINKFDNKNIVLYHIYPFGIKKLKYENVPQNTPSDRSFIPHFEEEGSIYIGITSKNLNALTHLHLYFNMSHSNPTELTQLAWYYLVNNTWKPMIDDQIVSDGTGGLQQSGIIVLDIPKNILSTSTMMPNGQYWLKISSKTGLPANGKLVSVVAHALMISREYMRVEIETNKSPILNSKLKPQKHYAEWYLLNSITGLDKITQQGNTFGGLHAENTNQYFCRISERLRHKKRAVTSWDYEHLVLEQFPKVQKVICINTNQLTPLQRNEVNIENTNTNVLVITASQPLKCFHKLACNTPLMSFMELMAIQNYLQGLSSPFAKVTVCNPQYITVQVRCMVSFTKHDQQGKMTDDLNNAISDYICPWSSVGPEKKFGWEINIQAMTTFINELPYIDEVFNLELNSVVQEVSPICLLVPSSHHIINFNKLSCKSAYGVGLDKVGHDFQIKQKNKDKREDNGTT
ncbi:baseplate J/gp47 family protein [Zooshikella sp. RANM57]|uniref:baseplate J/gp47 family protein n=1 Tax=Zooshikella sp. RANM57 TaxID=3425863 RepID=UPI003D6E2822